MKAQPNTKPNATIPVSTGLKAEIATPKTQTSTLHRQPQTPGKKAPDRKEASQKLTSSTQQKTTSNPFLQTRPAKPQSQQSSLPKTSSQRTSIALAAINKAVLVENERSQTTQTKKNR